MICGLQRALKNLDNEHLEMSTVYPGIPTPQPDVQSLTQTSLAMKNSLEILTGKTKSAAVSFSNLDQVTYNIDAYITQQGALVEQLSNITTDSSGQIASLQTEVDAQGVDISTNTTAISTVNGVLTGRYSLTINVSNKITGFSLLADNSGASSFDIVADRFNIWATGYSNTPVFSVSTIGGIAAVTINGNQIGDLSLLTDSIADNAVTNSAGGSGAGDSGTVSITVRPGGRVVAIGAYVGGDVIAALGGALTLSLTSSGAVVNIPSAQSGGFVIYYGAVAMSVHSYVSGGSVSARAQVNVGTGTTSVYLQELAK
jgi:hypothetical protein